MGASKKPAKNNLQVFLSELLHDPVGPAEQALAQFLLQNPEIMPECSGASPSQHAPKWGVAYSGGADSTALLYAAMRYFPNQVCALHVHHGLQDAADNFLEHCESQCQTLQIPFYQRRVNASHMPGESPEDAARNSRYLALADIAKAQDIHTVMLAQHADDQVETLILALSRGAGLPGLACMPAVFERHDVRFIRPILTAGGQALRQWLHGQQITWVEDPTNQDKRYTRNRIRLDILPAIANAFPQYHQTFVRSISHAAQAQTLLTEVAQQDLLIINNPPKIKQLQTLSQARQANALRYWLKFTHHTSASTKQMDELLSQIKACTTRGHRIDLKIGAGRVFRDKETIIFELKKHNKT